jgi:hypothetical protein
MMPLYAAGVEQLCAWLLGTQSDPPIPIPIRGEDGQLLTFEQRRDAATAAQPYKNKGPEERHALRRMSRGSWNFGGGPVIIRRR